MEVTAARRFSPKSEEPQTVSPKLKTMEPSEKTAAASERRGNVKKTTTNLHVVLLGCQKDVDDISFEKRSQLVDQKLV